MTHFKLDESNKMQSGFKVPEGYFDSLEQRIMEHLEQIPETKPNGRVLPLHRFSKRWMVAASVLVIATASIFFLMDKQQSDVPEVSEDYIAYQTSINQYDLIHELDHDDIRALQKDFPVDDQQIEELLQNNPDFEHILTE